MSENVEIVERGIEAWNRGDLTTWLATFTSDGEIDWLRSRGPLKGVYRGYGELESFWNEWFSTFEADRLETHGVTQAGSNVVVPNTAHLRGREGIEVTARSTFVFTVENGRIARLQMFQERAEALEAAGLSEEAMSEESAEPTPLELAKLFNEAGLRGDIETCLNLIAEDVVVTDFHGPLDEPDVHQGRDELLRYYGAFAEEFDDFNREVQEWVEAGDWVIAVGRWFGTGRASGARVEVRTASANRFRDGKVVECILGLPDKESALEAAGLSE